MRTLYGFLEKMLEKRAGVITDVGEIVTFSDYAYNYFGRFRVVDKGGRLMPPPESSKATFSVTYDVPEPLPELFTDFELKEKIYTVEMGSGEKKFLGGSHYYNLRLRRADGAEYECDVHLVMTSINAELARLLLGPFHVEKSYEDYDGNVIRVGSWKKDIYRIPVVAPEDHVGLEEFLTGAGVQLEKWPTPWFCPVREPPARKYEKYRPEITLYDLVHMAMNNCVFSPEVGKYSGIITSDCRVLGSEHISTLSSDGHESLEAPEPGTVSFALTGRGKTWRKVPELLLNKLEKEGIKLAEEGKSGCWPGRLWFRRSDGKEMKADFLKCYITIDGGSAFEALNFLDNIDGARLIYKKNGTVRRLDGSVYYFKPEDYQRLEDFLLEAGIGIKRQMPLWLTKPSGRRLSEKEARFFGY